MTCYYGLANPLQLREFVLVVCDALGHGSNNTAVQMMMETAAQETHGGRYRDPTPNGAGRGAFQIDKIPFYDVRARTREADIQRIHEEFGIDLRSVEHEQLDHSPMLAAIFCRLFYKLIPDPFPKTVEARSEYWKARYNTRLGKGTVEEYLENAKRYA